ncbi:coiled-coil domain-containing protein 34-like [Elysia marginata]|uniref:Coiled-coil domain-containing protein 34-like n=1 Tax=Elysia marginata TaxID=1093978 RepID=A0AAV4HDQ8_9GAST|nr:coiled-coil domain-containing protein 34-like [Elysia marginata]
MAGTLKIRQNVLRPGRHIKRYHDRSAYPQPSFYNPIPWHAPAVPTTIDKADKTRRPKAKPYKWNPNKYF